MTLEDNSVDSTSNSAGMCEHQVPFHLHCERCKVDRDPAPAYPSFQVRRVNNLERIDVLYPGLSKREHFAGLAMQVFIQTTHAVSKAEAEKAAGWACIYADALLKELAK